MLDGRPAAERLEQLEQRALLRRAGEDLVALQQRRNVHSEAYHALRLARRLRLVRAGERGGSAVRSATPSGTT